MRIIGVMSGTSMDGVDWVLCEVIKTKTQKINIQYIDMASTKLPKKLKEQLKKAAQHQTSMEELVETHHNLGRNYAQSLKRVLRAKKWRFDAIGLHGQTVYHQGEKKNKQRGTLQIGEPSYLRQEFQVPVVYDFRAADIAAGGEGAPLAPLFHKQVFAGYFKNKRVAVHNLGGISNVTYFHVDSKGASSNEIAFDTGPANMPIDLAMERLTKGKTTGTKFFDRSGNHARKGQIDEKTLKHLLKERFLKKKPPKSCGREEFGEVFLEKAFAMMKGKNQFDKLCTLTNLTAQSIEQAYRRFLPELPNVVVLCGGGAKNKFLVQRLKELLPEVSFHQVDEYDWPLNAVEGGAFALLAALRLWQIEVDNSRLTGASKSTLLGKIT